MFIKTFVKQFTDELPKYIEFDKRCYTASDDLVELQKTISTNIGRRPKHIGLFLGESKKKIFKPGFPLLDWISKRTKRKAVVDNKGAWLFLCGRDMFKSSVSISSVEEGLLIVQNGRGETLGYGKATKKGNLAVKNILDRGDFLRRER